MANSLLRTYCLLPEEYLIWVPDRVTGLLQWRVNIHTQKLLELI
jgi:hypothetical protein